MSAPSLELRRISKSFGSTRALSQADLSVFSGEIHALLGENGAGKSTLVSIAAGRLAADSGTVLRAGRLVRFARAKDARDGGLALVPQHDLLVGAASVADNLALLDRNAAFLESKAARRTRVARLAATFGLELGNADDRVDELPVGTRQRIEIAGALAGEPDVLILDEPTAVLSPDETAALFVALRRRADAGAAIVLITHRLAEVFAGADRLTLLARGKTVKACRIGRDDPGRDRRAPPRGLRRGRGRKRREDRILREAPTRSATAVQTSPSVGFRPEGLTREQSISLPSPRAGPSSSSRSTGTARTRSRPRVAGLGPFAGEVRVGEVALPASGDTLAFRAAGGAFVPADRREEGLVAGLTLAENLALPRPPGRFLLDRRTMRMHAARRLAAFAVRAASPDASAGDLSGGNQQKLVLARELAGTPRLVVAIHPTRGLDLAASAAVRARLAQACADGASALVVTADPDEAFLYGGEVRVVYRGSPGPPMPAGTPPAVLGRAMAGLAA